MVTNHWHYYEKAHEVGDLKVNSLLTDVVYRSQRLRINAVEPPFFLLFLLDEVQGTILHLSVYLLSKSLKGNISGYSDGSEFSRY